MLSLYMRTSPRRVIGPLLVAGFARAHSRRRYKERTTFPQVRQGRVMREGVRPQSRAANRLQDIRVTSYRTGRPLAAADVRRWQRRAIVDGDSTMQKAP